MVSGQNKNRNVECSRFRRHLRLQRAANQVTQPPDAAAIQDERLVRQRLSRELSQEALGVQRLGVSALSVQRAERSLVIGARQRHGS